jgi:hypothetical protein
VISAYLRPDPAEDATHITKRDQTIDEASRLFSNAFEAWKKQEHSDEDRLRHLTEVLRSAAEVGIWLFSHPCSFDFTWHVQEDSEDPKMVVAPGLVKVTNEKGQQLSRPQQLIEMETRKIHQ